MGENLNINVGGNVGNVGNGKWAYQKDMSTFITFS